MSQILIPAGSSMALEQKAVAAERMAASPWVRMAFAAEHFPESVEIADVSSLVRKVRIKGAATPTDRHAKRGFVLLELPAEIAESLRRSDENRALYFVHIDPQVVEELRRGLGAAANEGLLAEA